MREGLDEFLLICPSCHLVATASRNLPLRFRRSSWQAAAITVHLFSDWRFRFQAVLSALSPQWRIVFKWTDAGPEDVEIIDYH